MYEPDPLFNGESTELQDLDLLTFFNDFATIDNVPSTTQPPSTSLSEFEAQIQAIIAGNNNDLGSSEQSQNFPNNAAQDFNNFQYSVPTSPDNPLFGSPNKLASLSSLSSPESFLNSPNSYNTFDSPPQFNNLQDFTISNDAIMKDSHYSPTEESLFDQLTSSPTQQVDKKRVSTAFDRDSVSPDKSLKKKRKGLNGGIGKSVKRSSTGLKSSESSKVTLGRQLIKDEPTSLVSNMMRSDGTTQSIIVPSDPVVPSSNFSTNGAILSFNPGSWNQTINPTATNFVPDGIMEASSQFTNIPLLVRDGSSTAKLPINRLKSTITNSQPQQNIQSQPNKQQKKVAHNAIERRYRNNINERINDLKNVVPALCHLKSKDSKDEDDIDEVDGIPAATKLNKATILRKATEYINYLKSNNQKVKRENETLRKLIEALPGGVDLYNAYMAKQAEIEDPPTPPISSEGTPGSSLPGSPDHQDYADYSTPPTPPVGSRALMALFMCMTFFTSPSSYITQSHPNDHHHESRVLTSSSTPVAEKNSLDVNDGVLTVDLWYLARIFTFLMCLTYIIRPSLFSTQPRHSRKSNSFITSILNSKIKDAKELYQSLSSLSNGPANIFEIIIGLISESIKFSLRRFLGWDITSSYTYTDYEGRLFEVALWGRIGEAELCGGNDKVSRLSILYTCLRTINLLESSYTTRKYVSLSSSRIYANAALQSYIGLSGFPFFAGKVVTHFWKLANKENKCARNTGDKWLEIALNSDPKSEMWKEIVNRIRDSIFEKSHSELMKDITIPLSLVADVQAMFYLKQAFYNFISTKYGGKKRLALKTRQSFSFVELVRDTNSNSFTHWYALVGCCIEAFYLEHNKLGEHLINRLKDCPIFKSNENSYDKQIIAMGLLSYALLMQGKLEASLRCANKASIALTKRKEQRDSDGLLSNYSFEIEQDIHYLTEFCVGWIVLEAKSLGWKIVEGLSSSMNAITKQSADKENENENENENKENEKENENENKNENTSTSTSTKSTTPTLNNKTLPNMLDSERLQRAITLWSRYLRRLSKNLVFEDITKIRDIFIKKLVILESIVGGDCDNNSDDDDYNQQHVCNNINNSPSLSESGIRATKAWNILKGM